MDKDSLRTKISIVLSLILLTGLAVAIVGSPKLSLLGSDNVRERIKLYETGRVGVDYCAKGLPVKNFNNTFSCLSLKEVKAILSKDACKKLKVGLPKEVYLSPVADKFMVIIEAQKCTSFIINTKCFFKFKFLIFIDFYQINNML